MEQLILHGLAYMTDHPLLEWSSKVNRDRGTAGGGYTVVRGCDPMARGKLGDILALARENAQGTRIEEIAITRVDGEKILPGIWYGMDWKARSARL